MVKPSKETFEALEGLPLPQDTYETKAGVPVNGATEGEISAAFDHFMHAFEAFKTSNDERLDALEKRFGQDVLLDEKLNRINDHLSEQKHRLDKLSYKAARPALSSQSTLSHPTENIDKGFQSYLRTGELKGSNSLEVKSLRAEVDPEGGYLVPLITETKVMQALTSQSPLRAICDQRTVSSLVYKKPFATEGFGAGWVGETAARPETSTPTLDALTFQTMELYAMPAATQTLLDDAAVDLDEWLASEVEVAFGEQETKAFVTGTGTNEPTGFLSYPTIAEDSWSWGNIGTVATGTDGGFDANDPGDNLIDLIYALKASYRHNGHFVMNRQTEAEIRKIKGADGHYIWQPPQNGAGKPTLLGYPVVELEDMPDIDSGSLSVGFGDFKRAYLIVDRAGVRVLRDPFSAKPYVLFYTTKRVGGGLQDFSALKFLQFSS